LPSPCQHPYMAIAIARFGKCLCNTVKIKKRSVWTTPSTKGVSAAVASRLGLPSQPVSSGAECTADISIETRKHSPPQASYMLDLGKGHPDPALLPREAFAQACTAAAARFQDGDATGLRYGSKPEGSSSFLTELVAFLGRQCPDENVACEDGLLVTNGVSHGLELICSVLSKPGDAVLVEAPSYFLAVGIFESHGLEVVSVPTNDRGLDVEAVEQILDSRPPESSPVRFLYTVPANHNPTGRTLSGARRHCLVDVARRRGFFVLADEVYHLLDWHQPGKRPHRMVCFDPAYSTHKKQQLKPETNVEDDEAYGDQQDSSRTI